MEFYSRNGKPNRPCKECRKADTRKWQLDNPEKREVVRKRSALKLRDQHNIQARAYTARHPERKRASALNWVANNPEKRLEVVRLYVKRNLKKYNAYWHKRRAALAGNGGSHTDTEVLRLLESQSGCCAAPNCAMSIRTVYHVDHVLPLVLGGTDDISNIQLLCPTCNLRKGSKHPSVWLAELSRGIGSPFE